MKKKVTKNLQHGYIFLGVIIGIAFLTSLSVELYLTDSFALTQEAEPITEQVAEQEIELGEELEIIIQNLEDKQEVESEKISIVGVTFPDVKLFINGKETSVDETGRFERELDLIVGNNEINIKAELDGATSEKSVTIIRKEKQKEPEPEKKQEEKPTPNSSGGSTPNAPAPNPTPAPEPKPDPLPPTPSPITGLKMSCSISNTQPFVGESVTVSCRVTDNNGKAVSGAFGYVTVNFQTGNQVKTLSQSNSSGNMSTSFSVPAGNSGRVNGSVKVSKDGLTVTSNFSINVNG